MALARAAGDSAMVGGSVTEQLAKIQDKSVRSTCDTGLTGWADTSGSICMRRSPVISFEMNKYIFRVTSHHTKIPLNSRVSRAPPIPHI